jgi:glycosyltransferase involved in cell wall biosynthesis
VLTPARAGVPALTGPPSPAAPAQPRVLVVVPAYNEAATIGSVVLGLRDAAPELDRLIVTDGSRDGTQAVVESLGERQLELLCNVGYGRALQAGIRYALAHRYDVVVFLDGDGQHDPADVPLLLDALHETGADVVIGSRFSGGRGYAGPLGRRVGQFVFSLATRLLMGQRIFDTTSGMKAMRASACRAVVGGRFLDFHTEALVRLSMLGFKVSELPITVRERTFGRSMHSLASAVEYPVKTFLLTLVGALDALSQRRPR